MALDKLTKLTSQSGITTTIDYQMSDLTVDTITVQSGGLKMPVGMSTFQNVTVTGDLTVNGTTTTLDTDLIGVDKLEVSGSNTTAVGIITQAGSGDILRLYDSTTEVFKVADGGNVTTSGSVGIADSIIHVGNTDTSIRFPADDQIQLETAGSSRVNLTDDRFQILNRLLTSGDYNYLSGNSSTHTTLTLKKSSSGADSVDYLQLRDNSNALKFKISGDGILFTPDVLASHEGDTDTKIRFPNDDKVSVETGGSQRLLVQDAGAKVTGTLELTDSLYWDGDTLTTIDNAGISSTFRFKTGGTTVMDITATKNVHIKDDRQLLIGASNDLTIYHSSSTNKSYVTSATHDVIHSFNVGKPWTLQTTAAEKRVHCPTTKSVELYWNGTKKFETDKHGAIVTGVCTATSFSGALPISNDTNNRVLTATGSGGINGETNLTFDGNQLFTQTTGATDPLVVNTTYANKKAVIRETSDANSNTGLVIEKRHSSMHPANHWYGDIQFRGWDGSGYHRAGLIECVAVGTPSNDNMPGELRFSTNPGAASQTKILTITKDGNLYHTGGGNNRRYSFASDGTSHYMSFDSTLNGIKLNGYGGIAFETNGTNERLRIGSGGGVGINTSLIRNNRFLNIAAASQDYSSGSTNLTDGGGIMFQPTDTLPSTNRTYPGIFWSGNTASLGRARAGIIGITAANNDATHIAFLTRHAADGTAFYPTDEKMRLTKDGVLLVGHSSSPTSDGDKLQVVSTSGGHGINIFNYSASAYGNQIAFMKSRNGTIGGNTILNTGDRIGELNFYGNDGTNRSLGAQISVRVDASPGNDNTPSAIYLMTGTNQSMQTRLSVKSNGCVGVSKNGWSTSDNSFALTVHTGATSDSGAPVSDGIMIVSQNSSGNQNSTTGKLMFCGHAQVNGPFLYADNTQAYGKKDLVFHTRSTANDYTTQLAETARLTKSGHFGLGTETNVDSLMHIQGTSDNGDEYCQLTIEDTDTTAGSQIPSIQFKGNGTNTCRLRGSDGSGFQFHQWNGSAQIQRAIIGNPDEAGAFLLNADDRGWATFRWNNNTGMRTHVRMHYSPGNAVQTRDLIRIRRANWGWGFYKIRCRQIYYSGSYETTYYINGHGVNGDYYHVRKEDFGGDVSNNDWAACTITEHSSSSSPGSTSVYYTDVRVNIPNYRYAIIWIEAWGSGYSTDPTSMATNSYCLL